MGPDVWQRVKEIFQEVLKVGADEREAYLAEACGGDGGLEREVRILLEHHAAAGDFLEQPARSEGPGLGGSVAAAEDEASWVGRRVGAYEIVRKLGRGGTSTVYLASRADRAYRQKVAIKLLRRGMDTDDVLRRFRQERQILAGLDHPSIARLLDGGTTDDGRPFLVMEYVRGLRIDDYCDRHRLSTRRRLELFRTVCDAVHYAHRNLVVHRDLKPSNLLVTEEGLPKLLDFGIAKLLGPGLAAVSLVSTVGDRRVMTPHYASPEQIRGLPVTTASDVYSLGVLLYELLTGHRPYRLTRRLPQEIERVVCEEMPERPSMAVNRQEEVLAADGTIHTLTPEAVSRARGVQPEKLCRQLAGDLDNIVLMALRKEPERRYVSSNELSHDIGRYLEGLPVRARPASWSYRTGKFVARHKVGVAIVVAAWAALVLGLGVALWQANVARAERDRAEELLAEAKAQRARAEQVTSFLVNVFRVVEPGEARGETPTADVILARGAARIRQNLGEQPDVQATMMDTIGRVYYGLGLYDEATRLFAEALAIRRRIFGEEHLAVAESLYHGGWVDHALGNLDEAEPFYRRALEIRRALLAPDDPAVAEILNELAELVFDQGDLETAERWLLEALDIRRRALGPEHPDIATSLDDLATLYRARGRYERSEALHRDALAMRRKLLGPVHPAVASTWNGLSRVLLDQGRYDEAETAARDALKMWRRLHGEEHRAVAGSMVDVALALIAQGDPAAGAPLLREALAMSRRLLGDEHPDVVFTMNALGLCLTRLGSYDKAEGLLLESHRLLLDSRGPEHRGTRLAAERLAELYEAWGRPAKAAAYRSVPDPG